MAPIESPLDEFGNVTRKDNNPHNYHHHHIYHHGVDVVEVTDHADAANNNTNGGFVEPDDETIVIVDPAMATTEDAVELDSASTMPCTPSAMRLAELNPSTQFSGQRFYGTMGGWVPHLLGSCFRPMWNNIFSSQNDPCLTSDSSDADNFEISLEQIDVNFKENYIGGGNQSSVFRGKFNGRFIALKKLNRASEVDINTLKGLDHPNVIKTLGICTRDLYPMIIMEYCEKGGLFDVLRQIDVTKAIFLQWAGEIVEGMKYLHSRKIVHRDLKSPNILVDANDCMKICDFGSLYAWEKTYMPSVVMSVCGTSQWMSPEMLKNEPCNEKVDVWSFGVVLWELLTQEVPYKNISPMAIMYGVGSGQLNLHIPKSVPSVIEMLLNNCWSKRPRNRPSFASIFTHLSNLRVSIGDMSEDAWQMRKGVWRREICDENAKRCVLTDNAKDSAKEAEELVVKRRHELRHLQELRTLYERKTQRAEKYTKEVFAFYDDIRRYEAELMQREYELFGENRIRCNLPGRRIPQNFSKLSMRSDKLSASNHGTCRGGGQRPPQSSSPTQNDRITGAESLERMRNVQKGRAGGRLAKGEKSMIATTKNSQILRKNDDSRTNFGKIVYSCGNGGRRAVVTLSVDDVDEFNNNNYNNDTNIKQTTQKLKVRSANLNLQNNNCAVKNVIQLDSNECLNSDKQDGSFQHLNPLLDHDNIINHGKENYDDNDSAEGLSSSASSSIKGSDEEDEDFEQNDEIVFQNYQNSRRQREFSNERLQYSTLQCANPAYLNPASTTSNFNASAVTANPITANAENCREFSTTCPCCQYQFFNRNSLARASNMSSDSGFSHLEELPHRSNNNNSSFSNITTMTTDSHSSNFYANRSVSGNFDKYTSNNAGGSNRMIASNSKNLTNSSTPKGETKPQTRNRPIHIGAIGRAGGISYASTTSRGLTVTKQSGSYSFDESCSECGSQYHHLYRNEQGRWSEGRIQQRIRRIPRPASYVSSGMMNSVCENPTHPAVNASRSTNAENLSLKGNSSPTRRSANLTTVDSGISHEVGYSENDRGTSTKVLHSSGEKSKLPRRISSSKEVQRSSSGTKKIQNKETVDVSAAENVHSMHLERAVDVECEKTSSRIEGSLSEQNKTPQTFRRQSSSRTICYRSPKVYAFSRRSTSSQSLTITSSAKSSAAAAAKQSIPRVSELRKDSEELKRQRPTVLAAKNIEKKESSSNSSSPTKSLHGRLQAMESAGSKMVESSATTSVSAASMLASSELERSLEAAVAISDGFSDKEHKLRAAKSSFKTHRRTASNPLHLPPSCNHRPATVCETSTESDNDPVYC